MGEALGQASGLVELPQCGYSCVPEQDAQPGQLARLSAESLIQFGDLNPELQHWAGCSESPTQIIAGTLPVALFFYEDLDKLRQKIAQATSIWHASEFQYGALAIAYAITQALQEQLNPSTLIPRTVAYLHDVPLVKYLDQVQRLLEQGAGLDQTSTQLLQGATPATSTDVAIALAFYCFLSTLEDFRLTATRAVRTAHQPQLTAMLAAALSGAYNSSAGIPPGWRTLDQWLPQPQQPVSGLTIVQVDQLMAAWAGTYQPTRVTSDLSQRPVIAAPGVIRPR